MRVIGIIGGVASGKSLVAGELRRLGARVLNADRCGHQVLEEEAVRAAIQARWGDEVFAADGSVDRGAVARIVFAPAPEGPRERDFLEQLTHPRIAERLVKQIASGRREGVPAVVLDAPLLLEAKWDRLCDQIVFVDAPRPIRRQRASQRGWSEAEFNARELVQTPLDEKRARAHVTIDNSGTADDTSAQIQQFWSNLCAAEAD